MNAEDMIFNAVYKPAMEQGVKERTPKDSAIQAVNDYKKGKFKKINDLISGAIKQAKKL